MATTTTTYLYGPILEKRVESGPGGVPAAVLVTGKVTGSNVDLDSQIVDSTWAGAALADWYKRAGNIREMHAKDKAIGRAVDLRPAEDGDGYDVTARITVPDAVQKVLDGVLQGFSIGIGYPVVVPDKAAKRGRIKGGLISEVSLVDAPAYPDAKVSGMEVLWKMAGEDLDAIAPETVPTDATIDKAVDAGSDRKSPPKGYPQDKSEYADPERFGFPIDSPARIRSAMAYYNAGRGKGQQGRSESDWESIGRKIASAANEAFGPGHRLVGDQIEHEDDAKKVVKETLAGVIPVLVDSDDVPVLGNVRWIAKADGMLAVAADLSYDPFPTEERNGFGAPPEHPGGGFAESSPALVDVADKAAEPNGQHVVPGPNDASQFSEPSHPETPSVPSDFTPVDANTLAGASGGFNHQSPAALAKALDAQLDELLKATDPEIVKNGVARNLGPSATRLLYEMLQNEVGEDNGVGCCADDIFHVANAYKCLQEFIMSELAEDDDASNPMMSKAAKSGDSMRAIHDMAARLDPSVCTCYHDANKSADAALDPDTVKGLTDEITRLTAENTELQKQLDATPADGGPVQTLLAPPMVAASQVEPSRLNDALTAFANEREPRAKATRLREYLDLVRSR